MTSRLLPLFALFLAAPISIAGERPNFIIVFIDDMGYGDLGCYGGKEARTPHIDTLAAQGMRFTSFYAQPVCGPSRGALMTGRYPHRIGGGWTTQAGEVFVSEILQQSGYATACIGKWDMSGRKYQENLVPNAQGFDLYFGPLGANDDGIVRLWQDREEVSPTRDMASLTRLYTDKSIEFLKQHREQPFLLYLAHTMMHIVVDASPEFRNRTGKGLYADTLEELDAEVGRLFAALDELGLAENTVVIFTSDNGPWSNHCARQREKNVQHVEWTKGPETAWGSAGPLRGAKGSTWEGGVRVPAIIRWPGRIAAGSTTDAIVSTLDVLPTIASIAGASSAIPKDRIIDGVDQSDLLLGKSRDGSRNEFQYWSSGELQAVREGPWKLRLPGLKDLRGWAEFDKGTQETELYHLDNDIGESTNLASMHPDQVKRLMTLAEQAHSRKDP